MGKQQTSDFDFDDWAGLYLENPEEFEAKRQAALMIEMTKGTAEQSARGRALIESYEERVKGLDTQQRIRVSASFMMDSLQQLQTELMLLKHTIEEAQKQPASEPAPQLEKQSDTQMGE